MIHPDRIQALNFKPLQTQGRYVLYWMQAAQRIKQNQALAYALAQANQMDLPLLVYFGLKSDYPEASARVFRFMLEGLKELEDKFREMGVLFLPLETNPTEGALALAGQACLLVTDRGYLKHQRQWREEAARACPCPLVQVETEAVVPVELAYPKEAYGAHPLRRKLLPLTEVHLTALDMPPVKKPSLDLNLGLDKLDLSNPHAMIHKREWPVWGDPSLDIIGGESIAIHKLETFIARDLDNYALLKNDPGRGKTSGLSPYLHFGQISPITVALAILKYPGESARVFLDELLVRRELSMNYVHYNPQYDQYAGLPAWALVSLEAHRRDPREYRYELSQLEAGQTHDPYWNGAQKELVRTGIMQGYMRMYWGKKILEWTEEPDQGFQIALRLQNKYALDGRDPNTYAGVAWCFGKHDRPWSERAIFGKVRYMNEAGLKRKFDMQAYLDRLEGDIRPLSPSKS